MVGGGGGPHPTTARDYGFPYPGRVGAAALVAAMERAERHGAYGAAYLHALAASPAAPPAGVPPLALLEAPAQAEIDRALSAYEAYVRVSEVVP